MIKWLKRLFVYPILFLLTIIVIAVIIKPNFYYRAQRMVGIQLNWFGFEEKGNEYIKNSFLKIKGSIPSYSFHAVSVQNTKNGNYDEAIHYLEKAIEISPEDGDGYFGWVLLYYYRDYERALFHLERCDAATTDVTDYVGDDNILYAKGLCHKQLGNYEQALDLFSQAIADELKNHNENWITHHMYFQKGRTLDLLNRPEEAIDFYNKAIKSWDGCAEAIFYKGLAEIKLGQTEDGWANLQSAYHELKKGRKSSDNYVRLFDEVYELQIEEAMVEFCLNKK